MGPAYCGANGLYGRFAKRSQDAAQARLAAGQRRRVQRR